MRKVAYLVTQPIHGLDGQVLHQPGEILPEGHPTAGSREVTVTVVEVPDPPAAPKAELRTEPKTEEPRKPGGAR